MTTAQAKQRVAQTLHVLGLPPHKLTAKTVSFCDLARDSVVFVTVHNWTPSSIAAEIKRSAPAGVVVSFQGNFIGG